MIAIGRNFDFHAIIGANKNSNLLSSSTDAIACLPIMCIGWLLISILSWLFPQMLAERTGASPEGRHSHRWRRPTPDCKRHSFYHRCCIDHAHSLANAPKYQMLRILAMSIELLILLYFSYGMQLMGDDTPYPTSRNSWLEYGPRLGPRSSVRLDPNVTSALQLLPSLSLRGNIPLSIVLSPVHFLNPIASTVVRWSFGIESWMTHDLGLVDASDAIIWQSARAAGYMLEGARLTACRIGVWTGPSPRTERADTLSPVLAEQSPSSPAPPSPQQLNVKNVPYFQSVRGRALVARSKQ